MKRHSPSAAERRRQGALRPLAAWLSLLAVVMLAGGCRLDMHIQPKYRAYRPSSFFADGRSERPVVPGTVARGELRTDELMYTGRINGVEANVFPFPITKADIERGRQRFNIYCTPCHGYAGDARGMVVQRGFPTPPSYMSEKLVKAPVGHFFSVMTNGFGTMYSYADRIPVRDRWCIAAYIRVLQLSQHATPGDVPAGELRRLEASNQETHQ
jgi:mono/diheme cytochrome c family protein